MEHKSNARWYRQRRLLPHVPAGWAVPSVKQRLLEDMTSVRILKFSDLADFVPPEVRPLVKSSSEFLS